MTSIPLGLLIVFTLHGSSIEIESTSKHDNVSPPEDIVVGPLELTGWTRRSISRNASSSSHPGPTDRCPLRPDFPRLNTLLIEAYAAEPSRAHVQKMRSAAREHGAHFDLRIMASHGGTISIDARELAKTLIGGVIGGRYLAERLGTGNVVCTDIGGTSFDLALIADGTTTSRTSPTSGGSCSTSRSCRSTRWARSPSRRSCARSTSGS
jgi:Hydantoinase/oxoprolinase